MMLCCFFFPEATNIISEKPILKIFPYVIIVYPSSNKNLLWKLNFMVKEQELVFFTLAVEIASTKSTLTRC